MTKPDLDALAEENLATKISLGVVKRPTSAHQIDQLLAEERHLITKERN